MRIEFTRTKGAKDKRKRHRVTSGRFKKLNQIESGSRSVANLGRGLNSLGLATREARMTAKYFGINPSAKSKSKVGLLNKVRRTREGVDLINAVTRSGIGVRTLLR